MSVSVIETREALDDLAPAWRALSDRAATAHLFNDLDWLSAWWAAFAQPQDRLHMYALRRGDGLAALLPTYLPAPGGRASCDMAADGSDSETLPRPGTPPTLGGCRPPCARDPPRAVPCSRPPRSPSSR